MTVGMRVREEHCASSAHKDRNWTNGSSLGGEVVQSRPGVEMVEMAGVEAEVEAGRYWQSAPCYYNNRQQPSSQEHQAHNSDSDDTPSQQPHHPTPESAETPSKARARVDRYTERRPRLLLHNTAAPLSSTVSSLAHKTQADRPLVVPPFVGLYGLPRL